MGSDAHRGATIRLAEDGRTLRHIPVGDLILHTELRVATEKKMYTLLGAHAKTARVDVGNPSKLYENTTLR